jgi:hypothetical protein
MKVTDAIRPAGGKAALDLAVDVQPGWGDSWRVLVRRGTSTVLTCTATPRAGGLWIVNECLPRRRDPGLAALLVDVCDRLVADHGATQVVTLVPAFWDDELSAGGATLLQRIVPMWLPLDEDLLRMRSQPLPKALQLAPLTVSPETPRVLSALSDEPDQGGDLRLWQEICGGDFGPVIPDASRCVVEGDTVRAAIAVTEYHAAPLIAHLVTATDQRGSGLGRSLLVESLIGLARSGYVDCHLNVVEDNWVAHRLYRSIGFLPAGPTLRAGHLAGFGMR